MSNILICCWFFRSEMERGLCTETTDEARQASSQQYTVAANEEYGSQREVHRTGTSL